MRILIIDDSQADRELIMKYLKNDNEKNIFEVDESNCLSDAIEKISSGSYDTILLDLILPESIGIETIKSIREAIDKNGKNTPIIVLTGYEDYSVGKEAYKIGIKDFLIKGEFDRKDIARSIKFAIQSSNKNNKVYVA